MQPNPAPVEVGDVLAGKYRVERVLGVGGMGVVVAAMHLHLDQRVAIKFVLPGPGQSVDRFLREAKAAVRLKSEHVAKVLDVGTLDTGAPYMVLEYLEGQDLSQILEDQGPLTFEAAADFVLQACEAVAEAHSLGIVHRDLKPQNLFLTRGVGGQPLVKVLDFGISKMADVAGSGALTQTTSVMGSPVYMAPEQMRSSKNVVLQTDLWALGVVLQELLTRQVPFEAEAIPELCLKVVSEPPRSILLDRPDTPKELVAIIDRCLQKDPQHRFANAAELASALEPFATPASRVVAERARAVMTGHASSLPAVRATGVPLAIPSGATPARTASADVVSPTLVATTSTMGGAKKGNGPVIAIAAAAGAVALAAAMYFGTRPPPVAAPASAVAPTAVAPPVVSTVVVKEVPAAPAPTVAPVPSSSASAAASAAKPAEPAKAPKAVVAKPVAKPPGNDEIPSIR